MKIPIANALLENFNYNTFIGKKNKKFSKLQDLNFLPVNKKRFPSVNIIPEMNRGKSSAIIINAANEIFVDEFLKNHIKFDAIVGNLKLVLRDKSYIKTSNLNPNSIQKIYAIDNWARSTAKKIILKKVK